MNEPRPGRVSGSHGVVWVEGPDAIEFVDGQVSQDVAGMAPGGVARSFLLGPRGKLRALLWVLAGSDRVGLVTTSKEVPSVADALEAFRFRVKAEIRIGDAGLDSLWGAAPDQAHWTVGDWGLFAATGTGVHLGETGALEGETLTVGEADAHRVLAGEPVFGIDVDEKTIPQETGLVGEAVSFTKGCYLGQELVARIDSRGHVNRMLARVSAEAPQVPPLAEVWDQGSRAGVLTTVAPLGRGSVGMAMLPVAVGPGTEVEVKWPGGASPAVVSGYLREDSQSPNNAGR